LIWFNIISLTYFATIYKLMVWEIPQSHNF
jgi:hypothetical protein